MFGVSSLGTVSLEELRRKYKTPQVYQFYFHKDRGLNRDMIERAKEAGVEVMMLTVDSITGGNRERDLRTGFTIPFTLTLRGMVEFVLKPAWGFITLPTKGLGCLSLRSMWICGAEPCPLAATSQKCWIPACVGTMWPRW
jgi:isopentenyl diphosphate isomerase/L-lactate dehydrogenase-like FMN-dependent dehydrogenase